MTSILYPGIIERVKAVLFDACIMVAMMFGATSIFACFDVVSDSTRIAVFAFIFIFYDPLLTSVSGGTLGHRIVGIRVKRASDRAKNIVFPLALMRYIAKALLGWLSLLTVSGNAKRRAIHDMFVDSVVVYKKSGKTNVSHQPDEEE